MGGREYCDGSSGQPILLFVEGQKKNMYTYYLLDVEETTQRMDG